MGYDLIARNKASGDYSMGAFSWAWMLESGVGLPIGYGKGFRPEEFVHAVRPDGKSPMCNDGARITAAEAKQMAMVAHWLADYQDMLHQEWGKLDEAERKRMSDDHSCLYTLPVRRDFIEKVRRFAEWAKKSGGFKIK